MFRVLFVCTGNICRSPTAEGVMKALVKQHGLEDKIYIDSAGTSAWHEGEAPDFRSEACAKKFGVDLSGLRARQIVANDFKEFDLILGMDDNNMSYLLTNSPVKEKVQRLLEHAPSYGKNVPDPYYNNGFDYVFEMISVACGNLLDRIKDSNL